MGSLIVFSPAPKENLHWKIEKVEGRQAAREIIGGTKAYRRQYEKSLVALQAQKRGNRMDSDYDVARIDTGAKDENGQPILKFLKEFSTDSNEYRTWRKSYLDEDLELFQKLGIDSTVVDDIYIPEMSKEMFKNANYGTKQNQAFEYNKLQKTRPVIGTAVIINGLPKLIPMVLKSNGRWNRKITERN